MKQPKPPKNSPLKSPKTGLAPMQELFVREYLIDMNATQAAIRAGYSEDQASSLGYQLLQNPPVRAAVQKKLAERYDTLNITGERILREIAAVAFSNLKDVAEWDGVSFKLKPSDSLSPEQASLLRSISFTDSDSSSATGGSSSHSVSFNTFDKLKALELLAKNKALLTDRVEHSGGVAVVKTELDAKQFKELRAKFDSEY